MYAIVKSGARQYRVSQGDELIVDKLADKEGAKVTLDEVLFVGGAKPQIGDPLVKGAKVEATIKKHLKDDKVTVFKYKRRKNYKRTRGHRQDLTSLEIKKIVTK